MHDHGQTPDEEVFEDTTISRRRFVQLSAATGGALALPGNATANADADAYGSEYRYVLNHTPTEFQVPTLITFNSTSGLEAFEQLDVGEKVHTTSKPTAAAYAQLTTDEAQQVADLPTTEELTYTPGSNPFWRLDYYPVGVFPDPQRAVDYIDYHQMVSGMNHLESEHPGMLNFYAIASSENPHAEHINFGQSPGHYNRLADREDPQDLHIAEITNPPEGYDTIEEFRDTEEFEQRQKVMFEGPIHGLERPGPEACFRFVERLLTGNEPRIEPLLDECVIIILSVNPDGWVARQPAYDGNGVPAAPTYERGNAEVGDTNRQYPTIGWIDPNHYPGEPDEDRWANDNPSGIIDNVPDAMGNVEHFRQYSNLTHGADLHGMAQSENFVLGLINQIEFTQNQFHDLYEMNRILGESLEGVLDTWETAAEAQKAATGDFNVGAAGFGVLPESAYDFSTIWDTLGYTTSGAMIGWMGAATDRGGLDITTLAFEMAYGAGVAYDPVLVDMWVRGYLEAMRAVTEYALRDVESEIATADGDSTTVAFVDSDTVVRSSDDLSFLQEDSGDDTENTQLEQSSQEATVPAGATETVSISVDEGLYTLSVHTQSEAVFDVALQAPDGTTVREYRPSEREEPHHVHEPFNVRSPEAGEWTVELTSLAAEDTETVELQIATLSTETEQPDPRDALGFDQEEYEVSPVAFFEDLDADNELVGVERLTPATVASDGISADHLVVIHDDRGDAPEEYISAIDDFVEEGGNLVLTDTGLHLLGDMTTAPEVSADDITEETFGVGRLDEKNDDHPLLLDTRDIQRMTYKIAPLGYEYGDSAPMTLVDRSAFEAADGSVAGTTDGRVAAGSIFTDDESWQGMHVIGGLLPPASQETLHPFGLANYVLAFFGFTVFTNALGVEQQRFVDGEYVLSVGNAEQAPASENTASDE